MADVVREGMNVEAADGKKLGKVRRLFSAAARPAVDGEQDVAVSDQAGDGSTLTHLSEMPATYNVGAAGTSGYSTAQAVGVPPVPSDTTSEAADDVDQSPRVNQSSGGFAPSETKYMEVHHAGLLGFTGESIYVPFSAVAAISEDTVTLACSSGEATERYSEEPAALTD